jgi:DNA-binding response OmpR family regulator
MNHVLVVDDEVRVVTMLRRLLSQQGHSVTGAGNGALALEQLANDEFDLVLLDLRMPQCSGHQVLATMRERGDTTPVLVLSAVNDVATRVQSLDGGAVDFVTKPFHTSELLARIRRHLTVTPAREIDRSRFLAGGGIRLDLERRRATVDGADVVLSEREFALLAHLMRRSGSVCRRDELLHDIWGLDDDAGSNVVDVCVRRLRKRLGRPPIETVRGVGYCFYGV